MVDTLALGASANGVEVRVLFKARLSSYLLCFLWTVRKKEKNILTAFLHPSYNKRKNDFGAHGSIILLHTPPSSRGLGHFPFTEVTGIRIPLGVYKTN